jgi:hypothetical protein
MGQCGAGEEVDLVWLHLDAAGRARAQAAALVSSCWEARLGEAAPPETLDPKRPWIWAWEAFHDDEGSAGLVHSVTYDPTHPERGLKVQEQSAETFKATHPDLEL